MCLSGWPPYAKLEPELMGFLKVGILSGYLMKGETILDWENRNTTRKRLSNTLVKNLANHLFITIIWLLMIRLKTVFRYKQ